MIDPNIKSILELGSAQAFSIDPQHKDQIQRASLEAAVKEAKSALLRKRPVHIIVVKT